LSGDYHYCLFKQMIQQPSKVHLQVYGLRNKGMLLERLKHNIFWMKSF